MDSSRQMSFYIDELLTATKNEPLIKTHVRTSTLPRQELEIKGNHLSFKLPKSALGNAMENMTPGTIRLWHGNESMIFFIICCWIMWIERLYKYTVIINLKNILNYWCFISQTDELFWNLSLYSCSYQTVNLPKLTYCNKWDIWEDTGLST